MDKTSKYSLWLGLYAAFAGTSLFATTGTNVPNITYTVSISSPTDGGTYEKDSGETGSATAQKDEDGTITNITADISWSDDVSGNGGTSSDFTTSLGSKSLTATAESSSHSVTVDVVEIELTVPSSTQDGASAAFEIDLDPDSLTPTYKWAYKTPTGAGNLPTSNLFDDTTSASPEIGNAWWFASPDNKGSAAPTCSYTVEVELDFGVSKIIKTKTWNVFISSHPSGYLGWVRRPFISGEPAYEIYTHANGNDYYRIKAGNGSLTRNTPTNGDIQYAVLDSGQWKNKTRKHEEEHVKQWSTGAWKDYFSVSVMRARMDSISDTYAPNSAGLSALKQEVQNEISTYNNVETIRANNTSAQRESQARAAADNISPPYDFSGAN